MRVRDILATLTLTLLCATALIAAGPQAGGTEVEEPQSEVLQILYSAWFWEMLSYALLLLVMAKFALPALFKALNERQEKIESALQKADRVQAEAEELLKKHERMMAEANAKAKKITDDAIAAADKARNDMLEEAKAESRRIVENARNEIRLDQNKALAEVRQQAVELSLLASSAILEKSLDADDHRKLAEQAISAAADSLSGRN